jgi:8-oxo-dGTP diphosphatase
MERIVRCQGVILKGDKLLILRQYNEKRNNEYWMLPGGSLELGETEEECVKREIMEETNLEVEIVTILFDEPGTESNDYKRYVTYLCTPLGENLGRVGKETDASRRIVELVWCSILKENEWMLPILEPHFHPSMKRIKERLSHIILSASCS